MQGTMYGYARVSSREQNLDRQMRALSSFGIDESNIYTDKASGKNFDRRNYQQLIGIIRPGDVLAVTSIDRLGRSYGDILLQWRELTQVRQVAIVVLDMPLLDTRERPNDVTSVLIADIVLQLLSYVAEVERENIRSRQAEGIAAAKARGVSFGRPPKPLPDDWPQIREAYLRGEITRRQAARSLGVCDKTFLKWLNNHSE